MWALQYTRNSYTDDTCHYVHVHHVTTDQHARSPHMGTSHTCTLCTSTRLISSARAGRFTTEPTLRYQTSTNRLPTSALSCFVVLPTCVHGTRRVALCCSTTCGSPRFSQAIERGTSYNSIERHNRCWQDDLNPEKQIRSGSGRLE